MDQNAISDLLGLIVMIQERAESILPERVSPNKEAQRIATQILNEIHYIRGFVTAYKKADEEN